MTERNRDFETRAVQAGLRARPGGWQTTAPAIHLSTTFTYDSVGDVHRALDPLSQGFAYTRNANPTVETFESALASLEGTEAAVGFASGMAALHAAVLATGIRPSDHVLVADDLYGVTRSLLAGFFANLGVSVHFVDVLDLAAVEEELALRRPRAFVFEPLTNPLLRVPDTPRLIQLAHAAGALVIVDNTFATPYLFRPAELGADLVVHSATKYLGGHGDVTAGVVAADSDFAVVLRSIRTTTGGVLGPFEAWLALRGLRTLALRMRRHSENAATLAAWLEQQDAVVRVYYPGMSSHPQQQRAERLFADGRAGGVVAFELRPGAGAVERFMDALQLAVPGTSLGDVETLILYPAMSSHRTLTPEERAATGIGEGLVRVSVGIEHIDDIIEDFRQALATVNSPVKAGV